MDAYWTLDGAVGGSGAEIINHSCDPNLVSRVMKGHVLYISLRDIRPGEELTVSYNFSKDIERTDCSCGAKNCRSRTDLICAESVCVLRITLIFTSARRTSSTHPTAA